MLAVLLSAACASALAPREMPTACTRRALGGGAAAAALAALAPTRAVAYAKPGADGDDVGAVETAYFSGGDAKLLAPAFDAVLGVFAAETGAMGDGTRAVRVTYDPTVASYGRLLGQFWRAVDPTRADGQFDTAGAAYRTAIWPTDRREVASALTSKQRLDELGLFGDRRVVTEVVALPFSGAKAYGFVEDKSQDFAKKNKAEYAKLLEASGRNDWFAATYKGGKMFLLDGADPWPAGSFSSL